MNAFPTTPTRSPLATRFRADAPQWILIGLNLLLFAAFYGQFGDLIVDCSREATIPWRILHGDLIYRDFNYEYAPLAPYALALAYRLFGVHLLTLNLTGLLISMSVTLAVYVLSRVFLDRGLALGAGLLFVFVFAFQFSGGYDIFNYIFPYSYSASLGLLLLLLSFYASYRFLETGRTAWLSGWGLTFALGSLTKAEFILAQILLALLVLPFAILKARKECRAPLRHLTRWLWAFVWPAGLVLIPTGLYFAGQMDVPAYLRTEVVGMASLDRPAIQRAMGVERLAANLRTIGTACLSYAALILLFSGADVFAQTIEKRIRSKAARGLIGGGQWILVSAAAWLTVNWLVAFNVFAGMLAWLPLIGAAAMGAVWKDWRQGGLSGKAVLILCMSVVSFELLGRIVFNARPIGYGAFFLVPGMLLVLFCVFGFLPALFRRWGWQPRLYLWGFLVFFAVAGYQTFSVTLKCRHERRFPIRTARGTLKLPQDQQEALAQLMVFFRDKRDYTLLVLPEGNLINFLLDSPPATYSYAYVPPLLDTPAKENRLIRELQEIPLDYVLIVSRWTSEFGFPVVGIHYAQHLKQVIDANYQSVAQFGPPPFSQHGFGMLLMKRKTPLPPAETPAAPDHGVSPYKFPDGAPPPPAQPRERDDGPPVFHGT